MAFIWKAPSIDSDIRTSVAAQREFGFLMQNTGIGAYALN